MKGLLSPKTFNLANAIKVLRKEQETLAFFDFNHEQYYRWFQYSPESFIAGLIDKSHFDNRVKEMTEKEDWE